MRVQYEHYGESGQRSFPPAARAVRLGARGLKSPMVEYTDGKTGNCALRRAGKGLWRSHKTVAGRIAKARDVHKDVPRFSLRAILKKTISQFLREKALEDEKFRDFMEKPMKIL